MWEREQSESGWRLWIADVVLWGFGSGRARLDPSPAGWHRGEEEVTAPQHAAHKAESSEGEEGEKTRAEPTQTRAAARGGQNIRGWLHTHPNILQVLRQTTRKSHGLIHSKKQPRPKELCQG